jgi:hypothetical protein
MVLTPEQRFMAYYPNAVILPIGDGAAKETMPTVAEMLDDEDNTEFTEFLERKLESLDAAMAVLASPEFHSSEDISKALKDIKSATDIIGRFAEHAVNRREIQENAEDSAGDLGRLSLNAITNVSRNRQRTAAQPGYTEL